MGRTIGIEALDAQDVEDTGVTASAGQTPDLAHEAVLKAASSIVTVQADARRGCGS